jgi:hypothetical protein
MPKFFDPLVANAPYFFIAVGVIWLAIAFLTGSALILWPVVACAVAGLMLRRMPSHRFTWAWVVATASMGFLICAYQVYSWAGFLSGTFSGLAAGSFVSFAVLAVLHLFLFYAGTTKPGVREAAS